MKLSKFLSLKEKIILFTAFRQFFYMIAILGFIILIDYIARIYTSAVFAEGGIIENIQLLLLALAGITFMIAGYQSKHYRPLFLFCASLCCFAFFRELDGLFDKLLPVIKWKFVFIAPALSLYYLYKKRKKTYKYFYQFLSSSAFYMMCSAIIIAIPLAQRLGHKPFIKKALSVDASYYTPIRRLIEESIECVGYFILLLSAIECLIIFRDKKNKTDQIKKS